MKQGIKSIEELYQNLEEQRENRKDIIENCELMDAKVIDVSGTMMTIQICDTPERVRSFLKMLQGVRIVEITRTGTLAMTKCGD